MKSTFKKIFLLTIRTFVSILFVFRPVFKFLPVLGSFIISEWYKKKLKSCGKNSFIGKNLDVFGGKRITIGNNTTINNNSSITAWETYFDQKFEPSITIGDNCSIGEGAHITAINSIKIGNGVLFGKNVLVSDNSHGDNMYTQPDIRPQLRTLYSKAPVIIEDNVWVGQNVCILPGVVIGRNSIVGANSVVNSNVPENTIVAGIPAKIIKKMNQ